MNNLTHFTHYLDLAILHKGSNLKQSFPFVYIYKT